MQSGIHINGYKGNTIDIPKKAVLKGPDIAKVTPLKIFILIIHTLTRWLFQPMEILHLLMLFLFEDYSRTLDFMNIFI